MDTLTPDYQSYLLRLWRVRSNAAFPSHEEPVWRASLQHPHTGERVGFATLNHLFEYLRHQMGAPDSEERTERR
jgi:hypothetical protein